MRSLVPPLVVKGERDSERARATILQAEAAAAPALRQTVEALKGALDTERDRARDLRAERDRFLRDLEAQTVRRPWWPFRRAG
jgi:multidrug resistance efflux pump